MEDDHYGLFIGIVNAVPISLLLWWLCVWGIASLAGMKMTAAQLMIGIVGIGLAIAYVGWRLIRARRNRAPF